MYIVRNFQTSGSNEVEAYLNKKRIHTHNKDLLNNIKKLEKKNNNGARLISLSPRGMLGGKVRFSTF